MKPINPYQKLKTDSPEVNRLRNILAALVNLKTQLGEPKNIHEARWFNEADFSIRLYEKEIQRLRKKK